MCLLLIQLNVRYGFTLTITGFDISLEFLYVRNKSLLFLLFFPFNKWFEIRNVFLFSSSLVLRHFREISYFPTVVTFDIFKTALILKIISSTTKTILLFFRLVCSILSCFPFTLRNLSVFSIT